MRKQPQQKRARELVNRILKATENYIGLYGLEELTTPKISEHSGISVGSIYQYFSNKQEIIESLLEYKSHELGQDFKQFLLCQSFSDLRSMITASINFGFEQLQANNGYYLEILRHWHSLNGQKSIQILQAHFSELCMYILGKFYTGQSPERLELKVFIVVNSTIQTIMNYCSQGISKYSEQDIKQELTEMITGYLEK